MSAGPRRTRFVWQELVVTRAAGGVQVQTWRTVGGLWGRIVTSTGREALRGDQVQQADTVVLEFEGATRLRGSDRLVHMGDVYHLEGPINVEGRGAVIRVSCSRRPMLVATVGDRRVVGVGGYLVSVGVDDAA